MALASNFIREVVTASGTADYTLTGRPGSTWYIPFLTGFSSGSEVLYVVVSTSNKWEIVLGTVNSPSTLTRTTVIASWNGTTLGTSKISWSGPDGYLYAGCSATSANINGRFDGSKSADIASSGTTDIGAATGQYVVVTGTTTITSLGTVHAGVWRQVRFSGALTLTYNATSLILPGGIDITTTAGDTATFISLGSGNWICTSYLPSSGRSLRETWEYDVSSRVTNQAEIPFTGIPSWVNNIRLMWSVQPLTNNIEMFAQTYGADGILDNGGTDYRVTLQGILSPAATASLGASHAYAGITLGGSVGTNSTNLHTGWLEAHDIQAAVNTQFNGQSAYLLQDSSGWASYAVWGLRAEADRITGIRLVAGSGNLTGYARLIGQR